LAINLNDERQGEGGTLALINVNITTTLKILQDLFCLETINITYEFFVP
jgi:hypothetical protein